MISFPQPLVNTSSSVEPNSEQSPSISSVSNSKNIPITLFSPAPAIPQETVLAARALLEKAATPAKKSAEVRNAIKNNDPMLMNALLAESAELIQQSVNAPYHDYKINARIMRRNATLFEYALLKVSDKAVLLGILRMLESHNQWLPFETANFLTSLVKSEEPDTNTPFINYLQTTDPANPDMSSQIAFLCELMPFTKNFEFWSCFAKQLTKPYFVQSEKGVELLFAAAKANNEQALHILLNQIEKLAQTSSDPDFASKIINSKDQDGNTLMHYLYEYPKLAEILSGLEKGRVCRVDMSIENHNGQTALDCFLQKVAKNEQAGHYDALNTLLTALQEKVSAQATPEMEPCFAFSNEQRAQVQNALHEMKNIPALTDAGSQRQTTKLFLNAQSIQAQMARLHFDALPIKHTALNEARTLAKQELNQQKLYKILHEAIKQGDAEKVAALLTIMPKIGEQFLDFSYLDSRARRANKKGYQKLLQKSQATALDPERFIFARDVEKAKSIAETELVNGDYTSVIDALINKNKHLLTTLFAHAPWLKDKVDFLIDSALEQQKPSTRAANDILEYALFRAPNAQTLLVVTKFFEKHQRWQPKQELNSLFGFKENITPRYSFAFQSFLSDPQKSFDEKCEFLSYFVATTRNKSLLATLVEFLPSEQCSIESFGQLIFAAIQAKNWQMVWALLQKALLINKSTSNFYQDLLAYTNSAQKSITALSQESFVLKNMLEELAEVDLEHLAKKEQTFLDSFSLQALQEMPASIPASLVTDDIKKQAKEILAARPTPQHKQVAFCQAIANNNAALVSAMLELEPEIFDLQVMVSYRNPETQAQETLRFVNLFEYALRKVVSGDTLFVLFEHLKKQKGDDWSFTQDLLDESGDYFNAFTHFLHKTTQSADFQIDFLCKVIPSLDAEADSFSLASQLAPMHYQLSSSGNQILFAATKSDNRDVLEHLLQMLEKFDESMPNLSQRILNTQDSSGNTVLHYSFESPEIVGALAGFESIQQLNINAQIRNHLGQTPLARLIELIEKHGFRSQQLTTVKNLLEMKKGASRQNAFEHVETDVQRARALQDAARRYHFND